jgi:hypothetical protein
LQYGPCEEELQDIEKKLGCKIIRWEDTNLQTDLEAVAAIIENLDVVCSVGTAVAQISGAVGAHTLLCADSYNWTSFGTKGYPFQTSIKLVVGEEEKSMKSAVDKVIQNI